MASRASLMSGYRPDTLQIYNTKSLNDRAPDVLTLNQHFENNGYQVWASGKIYHHGIDHKQQFGANYFKAETREKAGEKLREICRDSYWDKIQTKKPVFESDNHKFNYR